MLKTFSLGLGLVIALGASSMSLAGGHKIFPSAQDPMPSSQSIPSAQSIGDGCGDVCTTKKPCALLEMFKPKPKTYTYEWVLKKKVCGGWFGHKSCGAPSCDSCGTTLPSAQYPSSQVPTTWSAPQSYGAPQAGYAASRMPAPMAPAAPMTQPESEPMKAPAGPTEPPPAPAVPAATPPTASTGGLQLLPSGN